jgi:VWFA-related protein
MFRRYGSEVRKLPIVTALAILLLLLSFPIPEQGIPSDSPGNGEYRISVNVGLVVLPVIVTDRKGKSVPDLEADSFHVFDDGRPQQISLFESEDVPVTVGLVIDNSGSMRNKLSEVIAASQEFAKSSNPHDEMFVVNFNQTVSLGLPEGIAFTSDVDQLTGAVSQNRASGNTALYDGLGAALDHMKAGTASRKALIVISDGADNASQMSLQQLLARAQASNVQIYALGVFDDMFAGKDMGVLKRLARVTGGKAYFPDSPNQITGICQQIAQDLRHQYTIGYHPNDTNHGGIYHSILVTARRTGDARLRVHTRTSYFMPPEMQSALPASVKASL